MPPELGNVRFRSDAFGRSRPKTDIAGTRSSGTDAMRGTPKGNTGMMRYLGAAVGFFVITAAYGTATVIVLGSMVMAHCVLDDAQIEAGETCIQPANLLLPTLILAVIVFGGIQWLYLRWALRKRK